MIMFGAAVSLALRYGGVDLNVGFDIGINGVSTCTRTTTESCNGFAYTICSSDNCKGYWAVYRICFSLAVFFGLMTLFTMVPSKFAVHAHLSYWFLKILGVAGLVAGTLFMPNDVFGGFAWVARFTSPIFAIYMLIMFIDFGYKVNELFVQKDEDEDVFFGCSNGGNTYKIFLILVTIAFYGASFTGTALMYSKYPSDDCTFNTLAITTNLIFGIISTIIGMTKVAPHASIFVSAVVTLYTTWMCASALSSFPVERCNPTLEHDGVWFTVISCVVASFTIGLVANSIKRIHAASSSVIGGGTGKVGEADVKVVIDEDGPSDQEVEPASFGWYHFLMMTISLYLAMLITDWGVEHGESYDSGSGEAGDDPRHNVGYASAWLKLTFTWVCSMLYLWTLLAPRICWWRDFDGVELEPLCDD